MALLLIVGLAAGFFGGIKYQQTKAVAGFRQFPNGLGRTNGQANGQMRLRQTGGAVTGEVISQDDSSLTVKMADGSTKIVIVSETAVINKASQGSKADLKVGENVAVFGTANSDGTVTAQNIQLGNNFFRGGPQNTTPVSPR